MSDTAALSTRGVSFAYGANQVIDNLDISIPAGAVTSIIGPNGCGKSTLVQILDGVLKPSAGQAFIGQSDTQSLTEKQRARLLAVLAQGGRSPSMTVASLVACGRYPHLQGGYRLSGEDRDIVDAAIEQVGIGHLRDRNVRTLSGGERQRAFVAMTLAQDTPTIILDEPTTYLDVSASHDLMHLIRRLNSETGKTFAMIMHDLDLALRCSDWLVMLHGGALVEAGDAQQIIASRAIEVAFGMEVHPMACEGHGTVYGLFTLPDEARSRD